jgi:hypothetical protein
MTSAGVIKTFNRFELKYFVEVRRLPALRAALAGRLVPDDNGVDGRYAITSLYYDSPDLACFWAKIDGERIRRKVRIRNYETATPISADSPVFVEIKQRVGRTTQKRRVVLPVASAYGLCAGESATFDDAADQAVADEIADLAKRFELRPVATTSYFREAWAGSWMDAGVRVTFDTHLLWRTSQLDLSIKGTGRDMLPPHLAIVELKINDRIPRWLTRVIAMHDMQASTFSKYCTAVQNSPLLSLSSSRSLHIDRLPQETITHGLV